MGSSSGKAVAAEMDILIDDHTRFSLPAPSSPPSYCSNSNHPYLANTYMSDFDEEDDEEEEEEKDLGCPEWGSAGIYELGLLLAINRDRGCRVYLASCRRGQDAFKRPVVVKCQDNLIPKNLALVKTEARVLGEIFIKDEKRHPYLPEFIEAFETRESFCVATAYSLGGDLLEFIDRFKRPIPPQAAQRVMGCVYGALDYAHNRGVLHCDVKIENIFIDRPCNTIEDLMYANFILGDWDLAFVTSTYTPESALIVRGSPNYAAPELFARTSNNTAACDSWSCGVVLYGLVCGELPFAVDCGTKVDRVRLANGQYSFRKPATDIPQIRMRELISRHLEVYPRSRITIQEAIHHPWMQMSSVTLGTRSWKRHSYPLAAADRPSEGKRNGQGIKKPPSR